MLTMKTSPNGRKFIEAWEGLYLKAYDDGTGVLTIGYGHTTAAGLPVVHMGMTITQEEADNILSSDLASVEADVNHHVTATINQNQFDALVAFDYNIGALDRSNVLSDLNAGRLDNIKPDLLMWSHGRVHGQLVVLPGLLRRRQAEYILFSTGEVFGP
jgi:lysozyme